MSESVANQSKEYLTIKEYASITHITTQAVYKKIKAGKDFAKYVKIINGVTMIHRSALGEDPETSADPVTEDKQQEDQASTEEPKPDHQDELIKLLQEQLSVKDQQIKDLTEALINAQKLQMAAERRLLALEDKSSVNEDNVPVNASENATEATESVYQSYDTATVVNDQNNESSPEAVEETKTEKRGWGFLKWLKRQ